MAEVFLAHEVASPDTSLVIKRMLPQLERDPDAVAMFIDEGQLGLKLTCPGVVRTLDIGVVQGAHYIALEHVDGCDLGALETRARTLGEPLPLPLCTWIVARVAEALHEAHVAVDATTRAPLHIVHRDMSPSNVLVSTSGELKVADFGVARSSVQQSRTATGLLKGKLTYMSPEQLDGQPIDARSDVYALGVILYELLTRRRLYAGLNEVQALRQILERTPAPPSHENASVDAELDGIVARALAKKPADRFTSARELARALDLWAAKHGGSAGTFRRFLADRPRLFHGDTDATEVTTPGRARASGKGGLKRVKTPSDRGGLRLHAKGADRPRELLLYVEDEPDNREVAALRLRRNYELLLAPDDVTACQIFKERGAELAAVLMDIQLKGSALDGIQLTKLLRGTLPMQSAPAHARDVPVLPRLPILFVTAYAARYSEPELIAAGGNRLVTKPVNFSELMLALVDLHLARATRA